MVSTPKRAWRGAARGSGAADEPAAAFRADLGDAGEILDAEAKAQYRQRLDNLRVELEEAERFNDLERATKNREEIEFLTEQLARATGLGGRDRKAASAAERARTNVTMAIRASLKRIAEQSPSLGRHLLTRSGLGSSVPTNRILASRFPDALEASPTPEPSHESAKSAFADRLEPIALP